MLVGPELMIPVSLGSASEYYMLIQTLVEHSRGLELQYDVLVDSGVYHSQAPQGSLEPDSIMVSHGC